MDPGPTLYLSEMFGDGPTTSESSASVSTSKTQAARYTWGVGERWVETTRQYGGWFVRNPATTHQLIW